MLHKVQLLIGAGRPELRAVINKILVLRFSFFVRKGNGGLFSKWRIRKHVVHTVTGVCQKRIRLLDRYISVNIADIVKIQIHQAELKGGRNQLRSVESLILQELLLLPVKCLPVFICDEIL